MKVISVPLVVLASAIDNVRAMEQTSEHAAAMDDVALTAARELQRMCALKPDQLQAWLALAGVSEYQEDALRQRLNVLAAATPRDTPLVRPEDWTRVIADSARVYGNADTLDGLTAAIYGGAAGGVVRQSPAKETAK